jgi:DNA-binding PadR family transcriptional regulator
MSERPRRRSHSRAGRTLWALAVLGLLREAPMHPYEMQRQMHLRHTDELLALKRGSLYHAIYQLQRDGLIEPVETSREGRRPERTVFRITDDGLDELLSWLRELLAEPVREPSQFTAALAHLSHLEAADALDQLRHRAVAVDATIAALHAVERGIAALLGRVSVLEVEYARTLLEAELHWLEGVIDDLRAGRLKLGVEKINLNVNNPNANVENYQTNEET